MTMALPIGPHSSGGEVMDRYVDLILGMFGAIQTTAEDRDALAEYLHTQAALWVDARYGLGLRHNAAIATDEDR